MTATKATAKKRAPRAKAKPTLKAKPSFEDSYAGAVEAGKPKCWLYRAGGWSRQNCTPMTAETRFAIYNAQTKLVALATQLALIGRDRDPFVLSGEIHWLHYFASQLGLSVANDTYYDPSDEIVYAVSSIIREHGKLPKQSSRMARRNTTAQAAADALLRLISPDFDKMIFFVLNERIMEGLADPESLKPSRTNR